MGDGNLEDYRSLKEARDELESSLDKGMRCPCCNQFAKRYKRKITSSMSYALVLIYKYFISNPDAEWVHIEDYFKTINNIPSSIRGDASKLRFWGFLDKKSGERSDGNPDNGYYRITRKGVDFVNNVLSVPKYVLIYNDEVFGFGGELIGIRKSLNNKFDYEELMYGVVSDVSGDSS